MTITKQVTFIAKDHTVKEMKELLSTMVEASKAEKGCILYDIFQFKNEPTKFMVVESWENEEALKGHQNTHHYNHYKANYAQYCADKYSDDLVVVK